MSFVQSVSDLGATGRCRGVSILGKMKAQVKALLARVRLVNIFLRGQFGPDEQANDSARRILVSCLHGTCLEVK